MTSLQVQSLLQVVYDPAAPAAHKRGAEAQLQQFGRSEGGLAWAVSTLQGPEADPQVLFHCAAVLREAAAFRWGGLPAGQRAAVRACLWQGLCQPPAQRPAFVAVKLATALARVAALDWPERYPEFWGEVAGCLGDEARLGAGLTVLAATLEELQSLASTTSVGLRGQVRAVGGRGRAAGGRAPDAANAHAVPRRPLGTQVLYSQIPGVQARLRELQPRSISALCSLLHGWAPQQAAQQWAPGQLAAMRHALRTLSKALVDLPPLQQAQQAGLTLPAVAGLLLEYAGAQAWAPPGSEAGEACTEMAAAALGCLADLAMQPQAPGDARETAELALGRLQARMGSAGPSR